MCMQFATRLRTHAVLPRRQLSVIFVQLSVIFVQTALSLIFGVVTAAVSPKGGCKKTRARPTPLVSRPTLTSSIHLLSLRLAGSRSTRQRSPMSHACSCSKAFLQAVKSTPLVVFGVGLVVPAFWGPICALKVVYQWNYTRFLAVCDVSLAALISCLWVVA